MTCFFMTRLLAKCTCVRVVPKNAPGPVISLDCNNYNVISCLNKHIYSLMGGGGRRRWICKFYFNIFSMTSALIEKLACLSKCTCHGKKMAKWRV